MPNTDFLRPARDPAADPANRYAVRPNRENRNYDVIGPDGQPIDSHECLDGAVRLAYEYQTDLGADGPRESGSGHSDGPYEGGHDFDGWRYEGQDAAEGGRPAREIDLF